VDSFAPSPFVSEDAVEFDTLLLGAPLGAPVKVAELEGQSGAAAVLYAGSLVGQSVITEHKSTLGKREQRYLVIYGNLESLRAKAGALIDSGSELGTVGNSATGHALGLHLEVRQVRHGVDARELRPDQMRQRAYTIACDARNVLAQVNP
jgi:septal ring factor EnvC (AmiA/AmiB activator)